ncbi:cyclic pyranopterin monophosphate synthase MoaC [Persicirhabdus sediminis]|uniref:cyclic pyranopterin monophosphate synthase n=1 Tax=Persicirhabdus sediminis TaxID=454144 RepID=A0A8J7MDR6_9BACT|nr:cyclic pyranopterin monophosphate synthase MoaC [Persicirhabdus sediminis]MBK1791112.1 cyclic pyranopterin monophosphate synthase MoaC [Persicirhabdus sediminis]
MSEFTHIDAQNQPGMVDVSEKKITKRTAVAESRIRVGEKIGELLVDGDLVSKKGPVFHTAIIAGTMAAKKTPELIPFCHGLALDDCKFHIEMVDSAEIVIRCTAVTLARTGVEMEALTGASVAALTIYDMCKAVDKGMEILTTRLIAKTGGKSDFQR